MNTGAHGILTLRRARAAAVVVAAACLASLVPAPARADDGATTVIIAAATAGATAIATLLVKDYFDDKKESERIARETEDILEEVKRLETRAEAIESENAELQTKIEAAAGVAEFWAVLLREDEEFFKPSLLTGRLLAYEEGLEKLFVRRPELVEKIHGAISEPAGDWERALLIRAYGAGTPGADFWELRKRIDVGLEGGVVLVAGERQPRYVSGAENMKAILDYVASVAGEEDYRKTLERLWGCTPEETEEVLAAFPAPE
ncbi:MAG: hypothetical protein JSU81_06300 [Candidatus Coatesbacteria bacterium]|nr:MAG: hypothetical protein JSU81_06300 [Candidatus Coatesbacteria bacterium]